MPDRVLIAYATKHGSTGEVARAIAERLAEQGVATDVHRTTQVRDIDAYDAVVFGAPLYMGKLLRGGRRFLSRNRKELAGVPLAVFALGPRGDTPEDRAEPQRQLESALARQPELRPVSVALFGGVIDPAKLRFPFKNMPAVDARDWDAIRAWAGALPEQLDADADAGDHTPALRR